MKKSFFCSATILALASLFPMPLSGADLNKEIIHAHWLFAAHRQQGQKMLPIQGGPRPVFKGKVQFLMDPIPPRVEFSGGGERLILADGPADANLPEKAFSVETWVRVDEPSEWGGIIGAIQDDPDVEAGWVLGYRNDRFCFGLASESQSKLTYLESDAAFTPGKWHHVVAGYSGSVMELWVDGSLVANSKAQEGKIRYPKHPFYEIGAYHDTNQDHPMKGAIHEIFLLNQSMSSDWIQARYQEKKDYFPKAGPEPVIMEISYGPFVDWLGPGKARISWEVDASMPTRIDLMGPEGEFRQFSHPESGSEHMVVFDQLQSDGEYTFRIHGPDQGDHAQFSTLYKFDTSFYYAPVGAGDPAFGSSNANPSND
ncbi:MAG: LamG domain-containing protein, partial [Verrucomicrobia bacterium]|nr:LamG domain-containing protein [Verrucomicrobiota bacterium]